MSNELRKALDLAPINSSGENIAPDGQIEDDFDFARKNLYDVIGKSQEALEDMIDVARQSQHPRAYEVLNQMLKNVAEISKDLVDLQKKKKDLIKKDDAPQSVHNNLFVGTTADLAKMIEDARNKAD
jgi:hypothetical protein